MIIDREVLERITSIDMILGWRFARRSLQRSLRLLARTIRPEGGEEIDRPAVIAGLETYWTSLDGWTLRVTAGSIIAPPGLPTADTTRPGTWSGKDDTDEDSSYIFELPNAVTVTPTSVPGGALASAEWWIVYARMETAIIESDSARKVFNQTAGTFDPASTTQKIGAHRPTIRIVRGDPGANLAHSSTQLPGSGNSEVAIAFVWIPAGATNLSAAQIYDVRPLHMHDSRPNEVGGSWSMSFNGAIAAPYTASTYAVSGHVWARHRGETLEVFNATETTLVGQLQPGASWGSGVNVDGIAWIYLCRVRGAVPRYVRLGEDLVGDNASDGPRVAGVLVISPTPPKLRVGQAGSSSAYRWDLRASASIALPDVAGPAKTHHFGGVTCAAEDAICVGMIGYDAVDASAGPSGQDIPQLKGPAALTPDGWLVGAGYNNQWESFFQSVGRTGAGATNGSVEAVVKEITVLGTPVTLPILGLRASVEVTVPTAGDNVTFSDWSGAIRRRGVDNGAGAYEAAAMVESWPQRPGWLTFRAATITTTSNMSGLPIVQWNGFRFPTREPLVTG